MPGKWSAVQSIQDVPLGTCAQLDYIEARLLAPSLPADLDGDSSTAYEITTLWRRIVSKWAPHDMHMNIGWNGLEPAGWIRQLAEEEVYDATMIGELAASVSDWFPAARAEFLEMTKLVRSSTADRSTYPKHWPIPSTSDSAIQGSLRGTSKLDPVVTESLLDQVMDDVQSWLIAELCDGRSQHRWAASCHFTVGYVQGQPTQHLALEWNVSAAHAYPITAEEAERICGPGLEVISTITAGPPGS